VSFLLEEVGFGLVTASMLVFGAGGFSLQYGLTNTFNFAYGAIMTSSAFAAYEAQTHGLGLAVSALIAALWGALFSASINALVYRPFARRGVGLFALAIVSASLGTVIQYILGLMFGESFVSLQLSSGHTYRLGSMIYTGTELLFMLMALVFFLLLELVLKFTKVGKAIRATAADPFLARVSGIRAERVVDGTWLVSGAMCGIAGFYLAAELGSFSFTSGQALLPSILAAAMIGRVGSARAAFGGALLVGVLTEVAAAYTNPSLDQVYAFAFLFVLLIVRPQGILRTSVEQVVA
jgi:branched-chain amino acid transport system permease protein/neutral amino acid transport system permease protein